jgi:transposase-like protein
MEPVLRVQLVNADDHQGPAAAVRRSLPKAKRQLGQVGQRWRTLLSEAMACLRHGVPAPSTYFAFPPAHWRRIRSTNGLERLHGESKRRTRAVGALPDRASALRLITAVASHTVALWRARLYLDVKPLASPALAEAA